MARELTCTGAEIIDGRLYIRLANGEELEFRSLAAARRYAAAAAAREAEVFAASLIDTALGTRDAEVDLSRIAGKTIRIATDTEAVR